MKTDSGRYQLVYDYYETRILYGFYIRGEHLPSILKICAIFQLAPATVRSALRLLEKRGYIKVAARKAAEVVYKARPGQFRKNAAEYFVPRKEGIIDLFQSGKLLFEPLWKTGIRQWNAEDWEDVRRTLKGTSADFVALPVKFYILVLGTLKNELVLNLYWEMIRYIRFPYLGGRREAGADCFAAGTDTKNETVSELEQKFEADYNAAVKELLIFIERARTEYSLADAEPVPFRWSIYRQRPQLRYTLASHIIRGVMNGQYPVGSYLPSLQQMANSYGVGLNTVRRTLGLLESMGLTKSYQGKGTLVCREPAKVDFTQTGTWEGIRLYRESLQLLALTIEQISLYTLNHAKEAEKSALADGLERIQRDGKSYLCFEAYLGFIEEHCPLSFVRECYRRLRELLAWGYSFVLFRIKGKSLHKEYAAIIAQAEMLLRQKRFPEFAHIWKKLMEREECQFQSAMDEILPGRR